MWPRALCELARQSRPLPGVQAHVVPEHLGPPLHACFDLALGGSWPCSSDDAGWPRSCALPTSLGFTCARGIGGRAPLDQSDSPRHTGRRRILVAPGRKHSLQKGGAVMDGASFKAALKASWFPAFLVLIVFDRRVDRLREGESSTRRRRVGRRPRRPERQRRLVDSSAAVAFDAIIESDKLAKRVGHQLRLPAPVVKGALSVNTVIPFFGNQHQSSLVNQCQGQRRLRLRRRSWMLRSSRAGSLYGRLNSTDPAGPRRSWRQSFKLPNTTLPPQRWPSTPYRQLGRRSLRRDLGPRKEITSFTTGGAGPCRRRRQCGHARRGGGLAGAAQLPPQQQLASLQPAQAQYQQLSTARHHAQANVQQIQNLQQLTDAAGRCPSTAR